MPLDPHIQDVIAEMKRSPDLHEPAREVVETHNAIPLVLDMGGALGLKASGEVIEILWDRPKEAKPVTNQREINMALFEASKRFPSLSHLAPARPQEAVVCSSCGGSGKANVPAKLQESVRCWCGGLGWLPDNASENPRVDVPFREQRPWWKFWSTVGERKTRPNSG